MSGPQFKPVEPSPNRWPLILAGIAVVLVVLIGGAWALGMGPFAPAATSAPTASAAATAASTAAPTTAATTEPTPEATDEPTDEPTEEPTTEPTEEPTAEVTPEATPEATPTAAADACADISGLLQNPGRLTLSTDLPAFPPWQGGSAPEQYPNEPEGGSPWSEIDFSAEPYAGEGFEGALAYAVAERMGFTPDLVDWVANADFNAVFTPGEKPFDFHMAQISATEERAQVVAFSEPYFLSNQSILALSANEITASTTIEELKAFRLGAAVGTTSLDLINEIIQPTAEVQAYNDNAGALQALRADLVDGVVFDLSTAFFMRDAELAGDPEGTIVGQFGPPAEPDNVAFLLEQGNPLVDCVNQALAEIMTDGTHEAILDQWINTGQDVPFLE